MQNTIILTFNHLHAEQSDILIALLGSVGFEAFEEKKDGLIACISETDFDEVSVKTVLAPLSVSYNKEVSAPRNWNAEWEQQYQPVILNDFAGIRADFHPPLQKVQYEIVITPKMSFGTGHHATTQLMMQAMKQIDFNRKKVFDFGTGTGVLAILASMLGAAHADAMDIDDWVVDNALENIEKNQISHVHAFVGHTPLKDQCYDIILANINRHILLEHMMNMRTALQPDGILIMSGFYEEDIPVLETAAQTVGLSVSVSDSLNQWACLMLQIKPLH